MMFVRSELNASGGTQSNEWCMARSSRPWRLSIAPRLQTAADTSISTSASGGDEASSNEAVEATVGQRRIAENPDGLLGVLDALGQPYAEVRLIAAPPVRTVAKRVMETAQLLVVKLMGGNVVADGAVVPLGSMIFQLHAQREAFVEAASADLLLVHGARVDGVEPSR